MKLPSILDIRGARDKPRDSCGGSAYSFLGGRSTSGETGTGTAQRDVVWLEVVSISVSFSVSSRWLKVLTRFKQKEKISVEYFDTETLERKKTEMHIFGYKAGLVKDTSYKGLWKVFFMLREF